MSCPEQFSHTKSGKIIEENVFSQFFSKNESNFRKFSYRVSKYKTQDIAEEYFWNFGY